MAAKRLKLELAPVAQEDGWYLLIDPTPIPGHECVVEPLGMDFASFEAHGRPGIWSHDRYNLPNALPLCQWDYRVENNAVAVRPNFDAPEDNPYSGPVKKLFEAGRLRLSAGLNVNEEGMITQGDRQYRHCTKTELEEVSFCLYGAHPQAGTPMSARDGVRLCLSPAVDDGTITAAEADSITGIVQDADPATPDPTNTEGETLRTELELVREENARLKIELTAARKPDAPSTAIDLSSIPAPEKTITREQAEAMFAQALQRVMVGFNATACAAVRATVRREFGRID
jgi:hypothetical protein